MVVICPEGGNTAKVSVRNTGSEDFAYAYLVTDTSNKLLAISEKDTIDFNGTPEGVCRVHGVSYDGNIIVEIGDTITDAVLTDRCFDLSSTHVRIFRTFPEAGRIEAIGETGDLMSCPGDNLPDRFIFRRIDEMDSLLESRYIITDVNNVVIDVPSINILDFEAAPEGICRIHSVTFSGNFILTIGDTLGLNAISTGCADISENYITLNRFAPNGGEVSVASGESALYICSDQIEPVTIEFSNNSSQPQKYDYVVTNSGDQIIEIIDTPFFTYQELPLGASRIWGVSYTGSRLLEAGDNLSFSSYSDACFDLSTNFLSVISDQVEAGQIELDNGDISKFFCLSSDEPTIVKYRNKESSNSKYQFVLTDNEQRIIKFLQDSTFDFSTIGAGSYHIWGVAYTGNQLLKINDNLIESAFSDDCFDITQEQITVIRDNPFAGELMARPGFSRVYTCPSNDDLDFVKFIPNNAIFLDYAFIVTDTLETIINFSFIDSLDFGLAAEGVCRVYGVSFEGSFTARIGNKLRNIAFSDECWDLSNNYVEVIRTSPPNTHNVFTSNGDTIATVCVGDGGIDEVTFTSDDASGVPKAFVATNEMDTILGFSVTSRLDFENAPAGKCRVYSVSYTGNFSSSLGSNVHSTIFGDDCYTVSDNFVTVERVTSGPLCLVSSESYSSESLFKISPNPFVNQINIELKELGRQLAINQLNLYNLQGQLIYSSKVIDNILNIEIELADAIYIAKLSNDRGNHWFQKIVKQ